MEDRDVKKPQRLAASDPLAVIEQDPGRRIWLQPEELQAMGWEILIPPGNGHPDAPISDHLVPSSVTATSTLHGQLPAFTPAATAAILLAPQQHPAASLPSGAASAPSYWLAQKPGQHGQLLLGSQGDWHYVPAAEHHPTQTNVLQPLVDHFQIIDAQQRVHTLQITQQPHNQITPYTASVLTQSQTPSTSGLTTAGPSSTTPAQFAGDVVGAVTEDHATLGGLLQAQGQLHVTDPDPQQDAVRAQLNTPLGYGVFSINQQGAWVYTADNSNPVIQQLAQGSVLLETVWVRSIDGSSQAITIKIHGTNDGAVIAGTDRGQVTEDQNLNTTSQLHASGTLTVTDPDAGQDHFIAQANTPTTYGVFAIDEHGLWTYTADNSQSAIQQLKAGATLTDSVTVSSADGTTHTISVTITGSNDTPVLSAQTQAVTEDGTQLTGQMVASDVDAGDAQTFSLSHTVDGFTLNADGSYSFDPSHASYQHLAAGQTQDVVIPITVTDSAGATSTQNLTITVTGTNDAAVITGHDFKELQEDVRVQAGNLLAVDGTLSISDPDAGEAHFITQSNVVGSGGYGHFSITADGQWHYEADNSQSAIQSLKPSDPRLIDTLVVTSADGSTHTLTVAIQGMNDAPVLQAQTQAVSEDGTQLTGQMVATDVDIGDTLTFSLANAVDGFTLNADGSYSFDPSHASYQHLAAGQTQDVVIPITVTDSAGASSTQNLTITVTGTNDSTVIGGDHTGAVTEDSAQAVSGQLTVADIDDGEAHFTAQTSTAAHYGVFSLDATGAWTYSLDNSNSAVQALKTGETLTDTLTVHSADGTAQSITITINGRDDGAVIAGSDTGQVTEDQNLNAASQLHTSGQLTVTDPDAGQDHFIAQTNTPTTYGVFAMDEHGLWTYTAENSQTAIQQLKAGATLTDSVTVSSVDGSTHTITVTITGSNDAPVLQAQTQAVTEDGAQLTGHMVATDVDAGDTQTFSLANAVDGFTLNADGSYSFDPSHASYQHLAAGQTQDVIIPITVTDSAGTTSTQSLTITVTGTNDAAVIRGVHTGAVTEDSTQALNGQLTVADVDDGQAHFTAQTNTAAHYGVFSLNASGAWTYTLDNSNSAVQALKTGETLTDTLTVHSADGTAQSITITINGRDDGAVIAGSDTGLVTEDQNLNPASQLHTSGQLTVTDPDAGQNHFIAQANTPGSYGVFAINEHGLWTYTADNSQATIQQLKVGATLTDSVLVSSADGTTHTISVTIVGSNDAPVLQAQTQFVTEDGTQLTGHMVATDVDASDTQTFSLANAVDGFTLNADGSYSFDPSHASYQHLAVGQTQDVVIPITVTDSAGATSTQNLTITVTGTNDAAVITGHDFKELQEDVRVQTGNLLAVDGTLSIADPDAGEAHFIAQSNIVGSGGYGHFSITADGQWHYEADNGQSAIQSLKPGDPRLIDTLVVTSADGSTHTLTVAIQGMNDAPVLQAQTQAVSEDGTQLTGQMVASDVDTGDTQTFSLAHAVDGFTLNADGSYSFDPSHASYQHLAAGQTRDVIIPITVTDSAGVTSTQNLTITVTGTNDAAVIGGVHTGAVTEDSAQAVTGQLTVADLDDGQAHFTAQTNTAAHYGVFSLDATGAWTYHLDNSNSAVQALKTGETLTDTLTVHSADGTTQSITITINGQDDGAVIAGTDRGQVTEDQNLNTTSQLHTSGTLTVTDPDAGQDHFIAQANTPTTYGVFAIDAHGLWTYTADNSQTAIQQLKAGATLTDSVTVSSADGTSHTITVTITGSNDAPVLLAQSQAVTEDGTQLTGQMVATDVDASDTQTFSLANAVDGFTLNDDGSYSFDPSHASYQHLAAGQTQDVIIPITVTDSAGASSTQNLTITLTGTNDGPQVTHGTAATAADLGAINEDTPRVFSEADLLRLVGASDVDDGAQLHIVAGTLTSAHGTFTGDAAHGYTFTPAANFSGQDVALQFSVTDGTVSREAFATLDINPVADVPDRLAGKPLANNFDSADGTGGWRTNSGAPIHLEASTLGGQGALLLHGQNTGVLHQDFDTFAGQRLQVTFDLSAADGRPASQLEVVWEGKVIATLGTSYNLHDWSHHVLDLVASGPGSRLEFRPANADRATGVKLDNIGLTFVDVRAEREAISNHDAQLHLEKEFVLTDTDGSESLHYLIKGLPVGFTLTDGTHSVTVAQADQEIDTRGWLQDALRVQAPQDYAGAVDIQVTARSEESGNQQTADSPLLPMRLNFESADVLKVAEDTPKTFSAGKLLALAGLVAAPGQPLSLSDVQVDAALGHFSHNSDGSWTFTPAANVSADQVPLTLTASGGAQPITAALSLVITPVADAPVGGLNFNTDFDHQAVGSDGWGFVDGAGMGWHTDYAKGIEVGQDKLYGGASSSNQIVELVAGGGSNLYRVLPTTAGQALRFGFDLSARAGNTVAALEVVWEGQVIDTIKPGSAFGLVHHDYDLVATGANSRIELRATGGDGRAIIDNIAISPPPVVGLVNHAVSLDLGLAFQLVDTDGSETISYLIKGLPVGAMLSDGTHSVTVATAGQVIDTKGWQLDTLTLQAPKDFEGQLDFKISAIAEEAVTHETAMSAEQSMRMTFEHLETAEDTPRSFSEAELLQLAGLRAPAGQTYVLNDVQVDAAFGQITHNADGSWTFTPALNVSADQVALNLTVTGGAQPQQIALPLQITAVTDAPQLGAGVSRSDFELERVTDSSGSQFFDPGKYGWHSDGAGGVEVGSETSFGGSRSGNQVLELISNGASGAKVPNLYRDLTTEPGQHLQFAFDLSRRAGWAVGPVEVLWEGKVIDTITPTDNGFALHHHAYDLVATGGSARLELRVLGDTVDQRAVLDNLYIGPPPQLALLNHELHLKLDDYFQLADNDGSESLSYLIKGLPVGFTLSDGSNSVTVTAADQEIDTKGWQQDALSVQAPKNFAGTLDLSISGRSEEASTHQTATTVELPLRLSFENLATTEDTPLTLSESKLLALAGVVPAAGEHLSLSDVQVDAAFGQFSHNADGSWTFTPAANVNADQVALQLTVAGGAQPITASLPLSITPVNDAPVLQAQTQAVTEDGTVLHGQLGATDVDAGDTLHYSLAHAVDGFTLNADGSYSFDPSHAAYQHLAGGQTQDLVIPVTVTDSAGAISTSNLTITVTGTDDGLQVAHATAATAADLGAIQEDAPRVFTEAELLQAVGASDLDDGTQLHIVAGSLSSPHGSFSGDAAHGYTFTPAANFSGQDVDLQFSVSDGTVSREAHAQLDITPVADAPVRSGGFSISTDFNSVDVGAAGWKLSDPSPLGWHSSEASGVEIGQERLYGGSGNNQILSLTASWSSNIYRDLATQAGQTVHVGFDLSARPGFAMTPVQVLWEGKVIDTISPTAGTYAMQHHGYDLVATGSNSHLEFRATGQGEARALFDNIQIGTPDHLTLGKQDVLLKPYLGYQLADTDGSETLSYELHGLPVGFTLTDGSHSVTVATAGQLIETRGWNQDALALRAPQDFHGDVSIQVSARSEEGSTHQTASAADLTLHLSGSHVAVISGESAITLTEDQHVNAQGKLEHVGKLTINDPDAGEAKFVPQNAVGTTYGSYTIGQDGNWIYQANNSQEAIQRLKTGEHLTDSFTVHSADGTAHTINVTIQGQDDAPAFVPHAGPTRSDDVYSQIGQAFESMIHRNFKYLGDMLLHGADTYPFERAVVVVKNAGVSFIAPDGSVAQAFAPHGTLTEVPIADMIAWHAKGAGYQVVFTDSKASEIGVYAHNSGNPGMLSGRGSYSDWVLHPEQSAAQLTPVMHDVSAASGGAAVQGAAFMPPAIAPLEFDSAHVLEDNGQQIAGFIEVKDADADQSSMQPQTGTATHYGRFSIDVNGDWVYQLDTQRPEVQQLTDGQTLIDTITVHSADGTAHEVNITIHGQNDGAVIAGTDSGTVVEDHHVTAAGTLVAKGQLTVTDADAGQAAFVAQNDVATQYGHFSLAADGHWTYTVDNTRADIQALQPGGTPGETADVSQALAQTLAQSNEAGFKAVAEALAQGQPGAVAGVLDLSIQGAAIVLSGPAGTQPVVYAMDGNGRSTIGVDELLSWLHQGKGYELHLQGMQSDVQVFVHDRGDAADLHALPLSASSDLANPANSAQHLALSWHVAPLPAELSETVTVRSVDGTEHTINLSIFGTAENAVIAGVDIGSVTEDAHVTGAGMIQTHGKLSIQDPNAGQAAFSAVHQLAGQYGQLSLEADGQWTYTADNNSAALNALNKGQSALETFVVKSVDGTAHSINITVNGADEKPDLWPEIARNLRAQSGGDTSGYHVIADRVAAGDSAGLANVVMNVFNGKPTLVDASGHVLHTFDRYNKFWGYYVPMNELADQLKAHPGAMLVLQGQVGGSANYYFHDAYDETKLNFQGAYRYQPSDHPIGSLPIAGLPHPGGAAQANTAAQLGGADSGSVLADGDAQLQTQGHLTVLDADGGQAHFKAEGHLQGRYGHFSINEQGSWHYQADGHQSSLQGLSAGQQLVDSVTVHSADGTAHQLNVHLFGGGAVAVIGMADVHTNFESQAVAAAGYEFVNPGRWDWQSDRSGGVELGAERLYGGASGSSNQIVELVATAGHPDNVYRVVSTAPGESLHFAFDLGGRNNYAGATVEVLWEGKVIDTITAPDKAWGLSHHSYDLIATGTDSRLELRTQAADGNHRVILDNLELVSQRLSTVNQDLQLHVDRNYQLADPQPGEQLSLVVKGLPVGFILTDGVHSATVATAGQVINTQGWDLQALAVRAPQDYTGSLQIQLSAHAVDAAGHASAAAGEQVLRIGFERLSVPEDTAQTFSAARLLALSGQQLPAGDSYALADVQVDPAFGHFSHNADSSWTFTPAANVAAESVPITLQISGGAQPVNASLQLSITPANDAPVLSAQAQTLMEDAPLFNGQMQATDPDAGDILSFATTASVAGFSLQANGHYTFNPGDAAYQHLAAGQTQDVVIPVTVTDRDGLHSTQNLTIHLTGQNDAAQITGIDHGQLQAGGAISAVGQLQISDADSGQAGFKAEQLGGSYGQLAIDEHGQWSYMLDASNPQVQQLTNQQQLTEQLSVHGLDGTAHSIEITITGQAGQTPQVSTPQQTPGQTAFAGADVYSGIVASVHGAGYQYRELAAALDHGDNAPFANLELSIMGSHVQVLDQAGHVVQSFDPVGIDYAATMSMNDVMSWHNQGYAIVVHQDSGLATTGMWLHNAGDPHAISIRNADGSGSNGWADQWTFGQLQLPTTAPAPAPAPAPAAYAAFAQDTPDADSSAVDVHSGVDVYLQLASANHNPPPVNTEAIPQGVSEYLQHAGVDIHTVAINPVEPMDMPHEHAAAIPLSADDQLMTPLPEDHATLLVPSDDHQHLPLPDDPQHHGV